jgi:hypothetical protein
MWKDFWALAIHNADFVSIFTVAILVLAFQTLVKYITKLPIILNKPPDEEEKQAAYFDCLQMGVDLSLLGFVASLGVLQLAIKSSLHSGSVEQVAAFQTEFILVQLILIALVIIFTMMFRSPKETFYRGIFIPSIIGAFSLYISISIFKFFKLG